MNNAQLLDAISDIDDDLIEETYAVLNREKSRGRGSMVRRLGVLAACLVLAVCAAVISASPGSDLTFLNTEELRLSLGFGGAFMAVEEYPWDDSYLLKVYMEDSSYKPEESTQLLIEVGLKDDVLGQGDLLIFFDDDFFAITCDQAQVQDNCIVIENFTRQTYPRNDPLKLTVQLRAPSVDSNCGTVRLYVCFIPEDMQAFSGYGAFWHDGEVIPEPVKETIILKRCSIGYALNDLEICFSKGEYGAEIFRSMLENQLRQGKISEETYVAQHYTYYYRNHIRVCRERYDPESQTFRLEYFSKNIRYVSEDFLSDPELWPLFQQLETFDVMNDPTEESAQLYRELAKKVLARMLADGVITRQEYDAELLWVDAAGSISNMTYIIESGLRERLFDLYTYTHFDP